MVTLPLFVVAVTRFSSTSRISTGTGLLPMLTAVVPAAPVAVKQASKMVVPAGRVTPAKVLSIQENVSVPALGLAKLLAVNPGRLKPWKVWKESAAAL